MIGISQYLVNINKVEHINLYNSKSAVHKQYKRSNRSLNLQKSYFTEKKIKVNTYYLRAQNIRVYKYDLFQ